MIEGLLIICLVAIIIALISQNSTKSKFQSAIKFLDKKKYERSQKILQQIFHKHPEAISTFAKSLYLNGNEISNNNKKDALDLYNKVVKCEKLLTSKDNKESFQVHLVNTHFEIARINLSYIQTNGTGEENDLIENLQYIDSVPKQGREKDFQDLIDEHYFRLSTVYYDKGVEYEKEKEFLKAIEFYNKATVKIKAATNLENNFNSIFRAEICKLKDGQNVNFYDLEQLEDKSHPFRNDLIYRYSIYILTKNTDYLEAERLLKTLPKSKEISKLLSRCNYERIKLANERVFELNSKIKNLYNQEFSDKEFTDLYDSVNLFAEEYRKFIPELSDQLDRLKPSIFNRIIQNCYKEKRYGKALNLLVKVPQFHKSPTILKNAGNACIYYIQNDEITDKNFKHIISLFLTSAYSDRVFLHSLSETEWDNEYTFTLIDSIGSNFQLNNSLPNNVNYDDVSTSNISIGIAQKELLSQFELLLIDKINDQKFREKAHSFFYEEKEALDALIKHLNREMTFPSPFFAKTYKIQGDVIKALEEEYNITNDEAYLQVGIPYSDSTHMGPINNYKETSIILDNIVSAIKKEDKELLDQYITKESRKMIGQYEQFIEFAEEVIMKAFQMRIDKDEKNESLIPLFNKALSLSPDFNNLNYQYANFVLNLCIAKVNADEIKFPKALKLVIPVYLLQPDNPRVCKNLVTLVKVTLFDVINDEIISPSSVFKEIDRIKQNLSEVFIQNAGELRQAREEFLSRLSAENRSAIMTGYNLSRDGQIAKQALDYMAELSGSEIAYDPLAILRSRLGI